MRGAKARARANIALAKYWGKADAARNLPAVPSLSVTLEPLVTETTVVLDDALAEDVLELDGRPAGPKETARAARLLDAVRTRLLGAVNRGGGGATGSAAAFDAAERVPTELLAAAARGRLPRARVRSHNGFPTASGLASSASGFAALAGAACAAYGVRASQAELSALARAASASAARSVFGGFAKLPAGDPAAADDDPRGGALAASPLFPPSHWDVAVVVAVADEGPKDTGSTEGMERSRASSPYYDAWVRTAQSLCDEVEAGVRARDLERAGVAMEHSTLAMHACAMASRPGILYMRPPTLAALETVRALRRSGVGVYATMDAGPHVKALCIDSDTNAVAAALGATPGILRTVIARPGAGLEVVQEAAR
jgi:diphosphomevalonate decarboxylase